MATARDLDVDRVSKREFQQRFARRADIPLRTAIKAYDAMIDELKDLVRSGKRVTLTGFGKFYMQEHKGHTVHFASGGEKGGVVEDYAVLRFSSSTNMNKSLKAKAEDADSEAEAE